MTSPIILIAIPFFMILIALEFILSIKLKRDLYRFNDTFSNLACGILSTTTKLFSIGLGYQVWNWLLEGYALFNWNSASIWTWLFAWVAYDFCYYWFHRLSHEWAVLWLGHVVHHQSEGFNLSTALRQSSINILNWVYYLPLFLLGIPFEVFATVASLNLIYQYWVHTCLINTLGPLEKIFVTPSNHRAHHAQNAIYINKNYGGVFILWDRIFATYQPEEASEPVIFGVRKPLNSFDPAWANAQSIFDLLSDIWYARSNRDRVRILFSSTGFRPAYLIKNRPQLRTDLTHFVAFNPCITLFPKIYSAHLLIIGVMASLALLVSAAPFSMAEQFSIFIMATFPLLTGARILNAKKYCIQFELLRLAITPVLGIYYGQSIFIITILLSLAGVTALILSHSLFNGSPHESKSASRIKPEYTDSIQ